MTLLLIIPLSLMIQVPAAFWVLYYILRTPSVRDEVVAEVAAARAAGAGAGAASGGAGLGAASALLSQAQLNGLVLLDACITESMRLASGARGRDLS